MHPTHRSILARAKDYSAATYLYRFNFDSPAFSLTKKLLVGKNVQGRHCMQYEQKSVILNSPIFSGACHGDDLSYLFRNVLAGVPSRTSNEWKTIDRMCACWTQFARTGNPNNETIAPFLWKPVELVATNTVRVSTYKCLNFAEDISVIDVPELERLHFWDDLYEQNYFDVTGSN